MPEAPLSRREDITVEILRDLLRYDPATGQLFWRGRPAKYFADEARGRGWNTRYSGAQALAADHGDGYLYGSIGKHLFMAHRVVFALHFGKWPEGIVDHKDGDRGNNRPDNLRDTNNSMNAKNAKLRLDNHSGFPGVHWCAQKRKWQARLFSSEGTLRIGFFNCPTAAGIARKRAQAGMGFTQRHGERNKNALYA